jgi:5-methylcytosine-specific restriction endonuclease McrA
MKTCSGCKLEKELCSFNKMRKNYDGLQNYCRKCQSSYALKNKEDQREHRKLATKRHRKTVKAKKTKNAWQRQDRKKNPYPYRIRELSVKIRNRGNFRKPEYEEFKKMLKALPKFCVVCESTEDLTLDHVIPLTKGGEGFDPANLTTLCRSCNSSKGNRFSSIEEYLESN